MLLLRLTPPRERRLLLPLSTWTQGLMPPPLLTAPLRRERGVVRTGRHTKPVARLSMPPRSPEPPAHHQVSSGSGSCGPAYEARRKAFYASKKQGFLRLKEAPNHQRTIDSGSNGCYRSGREGCMTAMQTAPLRRRLWYTCLWVVVAAFAGLLRLPCCLRGVTTGDAYLFDRLGGFSGGVRLLSCSCPLVL